MSQDFNVFRDRHILHMVEKAVIWITANLWVEKFMLLQHFCKLCRKVFVGWLWTVHFIWLIEDNVIVFLIFSYMREALPEWRSLRYGQQMYLPSWICSAILWKVRYSFQCVWISWCDQSIPKISFYNMKQNLVHRITIAVLSICVQVS